MPKLDSPRSRAVLQALFVTFLWSTSWVFIKMGLQDIPALTFAGLRYLLAFLCLLPFAIRRSELQLMRSLPTRGWVQVILLGLALYALTQGAQFLSLAYLPAITTSLVLSLTATVVALAGIPLLGERLGGIQWLGVCFNLAGIATFFFPFSLRHAPLVGLAVAFLGLLANAFSSILGRHINRQTTLSPLAVTVISMGIGAAVLMIVGLAFQGLPQLSLRSWLIILWLAAVNSAFAFTLWNRTLQTLSAAESSMINNTMLFQIAVLAWVFLGETMSPRQVLGMILAGIGTAAIQIRQ